MIVESIAVETNMAGRNARNEMAIEHLSLVRTIAASVRQTLPVRVELDDLIQAGALGLIDAAAKYVPEKNVEFRAYAKFRIRGAILDSVRQRDWASRDIRRQKKEVETATGGLVAELGRTPTDDEVAVRMGVGLDRFRRMQTHIQTVSIVSLTPRSSDDRDYADQIPGRPEFRPDHICESKRLHETMSGVVHKLPARYRLVIEMYYVQSKTMKEIGTALGVNESRVSQIHKAALKKMQAELESAKIDSASAFRRAS